MAGIIRTVSNVGEARGRQAGIGFSGVKGQADAFEPRVTDAALRMKGRYWVL